MKGSTELPTSQPSRRKFLGSALAGTAATLAGAASMSFFSTAPAFAQSNFTPDQALKELLDGNQRYIAGRFTSFDEDKQILRDRTVEKQQPFAALLSCADSRVPIEIIFDQSIGELFVTRVAGNIVTPEIIASLEYGAAVLGTKVIMVLGHSGCGAVKAAIAGKEVPGQISALFPPLRPAVDQAGPDLAATTKKNASIQATLLSEASTVLSPMVKEGKLKIVGAYYDLATGKVTQV
ncbi:MAG: carbonic anhydrase [Silvibacterium sp.]